MIYLTFHLFHFVPGNCVLHAENVNRGCLRDICAEGLPFRALIQSVACQQPIKLDEAAPLRATFLKDSKGPSESFLSLSSSLGERQMAVHHIVQTSESIPPPTGTIFALLLKAHLQGPSKLFFSIRSLRQLIRATPTVA
uniref:Secreted protein n=1 Tax=Steinernema glaseri TaxID=37863 RepID=A0A1I8A5M7_9BILA